jgi:hypothetical protein
LSRYHLDHPYEVTVNGTVNRVQYEPAESTTGMFGGNSNWRGPIWFPVNYLLIESLQKFHYYLGDDYKVEFPTGSGHMLTLWECSLELARRLLGLFRTAENGRRPFLGDDATLQTSPYWKDQILFHEFFHGDTGEGLGASHQTGWTALVAKMVDQLARYADPAAQALLAAEFGVVPRM